VWSTVVQPNKDHVLHFDKQFGADYGDYLSDTLELVVAQLMAQKHCW
jgi:hypothetical protein